MVTPGHPRLRLFRRQLSAACSHHLVVLVVLSTPQLRASRTKVGKACGQDPHPGLFPAASGCSEALFQAAFPRRDMQPGPALCPLFVMRICTKSKS